MVKILLNRKTGTKNLWLIRTGKLDAVSLHIRDDKATGSEPLRSSADGLAHRRTSMLRGVMVAAMITLAPIPSFAFYQELTCERNTVTGAIELDSEGAYVVRNFDSHRIIAEKDVGMTPRPARSGRPNWVFGICVVESHWSRSPEDAPIRFPRQ
jgi:hypothetical protein